MDGRQGDARLSGAFPQVGRIISAAIVGTLVLAGTARAEPTLGEFEQSALRDFTASTTIVQKNPAVLDKIGRNFAQGYRVRESVIW